MQQIGKVGDIYLAHSEALRNQLKYTKQIWQKVPPSTLSSSVLIKGTLTKQTKDRKSILTNYQLSSSGVLMKCNNDGQAKSYFPLLDRFIFLQYRIDESGLSTIQLELYGKKKLFSDQNSETIKTWVDLLCQFCIGKGFVGKRFDFQQQIAKGNFSKVYLVERYDTKERFSCKCYLKEDLLRSPKLQDSVLSEAFLLRPLKHPNILSIEEIHDDATSLYFIYKIQSCDLFENFRTHKIKKVSYTEEEGKKIINHQKVAEIMINLMKGLQYIHSKQIMHRDIKLENILLQQQGRNDLVIADFGLAIKFDSQKGVFKKCGTPGYIAPEVLNFGVYNHKADIFSSGIVCYILLCQKPAFRGNNISTILTENTSGRINFTQPYFTKLSLPAQNFVKSLLNLREDQRPNADECLESEYLKSFKPSTSISRSPKAQPKQLQNTLPQFLSASILPKSINLQKARRRSMRQYILLKQALTAQKVGEQMAALTPDQLLQQMQEQGQVLSEENEIMDEEETKVDDANKLIVCDSIEKMKEGFYTEIPKEVEEMQSDDSCSSDEDNDQLLFVEDGPSEDSLQSKMRALKPLLIRRKTQK